MTNGKTTTNGMNNSDAVSTNNYTNRAILLIIDSLTHLFAIFGESSVITFVTQLYFLLKKIEGQAMLYLDDAFYKRVCNLKFHSRRDS